MTVAIVLVVLGIGLSVWWLTAEQGTGDGPDPVARPVSGAPSGTRDAADDTRDGAVDARVAEIGLLGAEAGRGDPRTVALPQVADPSAVTEFLVGEGASLVQVLAPLADLVDEPVDCESVASDLDALAPPGDLLALTGQFDDPDAAVLWQNLHASSVARMARCGDSSEDSDAARRELGFHWTVAARFVQELGIDPLESR